MAGHTRAEPTWLLPWERRRIHCPVREWFSIMTRNQEQRRASSGLTNQLGISKWACLLGVPGELGRGYKEIGLKWERLNFLLTEMLPQADE